MDFASVLPTFAITLREGVEAALVVGIVLAYLKKANRAHLARWVWSGVGLGLVASAIIGGLFGWLIAHLGEANQRYAPVIEPLLEGVFSVLAIAMLSWMLLWMTRQARAMKGQLETSVGVALQRDEQAGWAILGLIVFAVVREGFETVLFIASRFEEGLFATLGAVLGIAAAALIALLLFKWGVRIDLRRFFQTMGVLLLLIVAGLVVAALAHFDAALHAFAQIDRASEQLCFFSERFSRNASCILGPGIWDGSRVLPENRFPGALLNALFGYTEHFYLVQLVGYALFIALVGGLYWQSLSGRPLLPFKKRTPLNTTLH
ncbi:FTR1 family iron permease [Gloeobacter kilaueensis]|uniref:Iron permease FTR1 n=1 Tax=Gloeobacter kilaueensis (strain ATCC BAA-2537 / CCAP 1431/1 / ULC 316 / JS1) TaxID=1183438 RepID=U5QRC7_GLOK1|nr:FTR1 family protein [Gloeobacter kilaueensis]AGY60270.1 iron permease FTR1 [Gloeobacter kilaueensis JS1]